MSHKIIAEEVRKMGLIEYLKKYKSKMSKKQIYQIGRNYMWENYMLNAHTHALLTNKILKQLEEDQEE